MSANVLLRHVLSLSLLFSAPAYADCGWFLGAIKNALQGMFQEEDNTPISQDQKARDKAREVLAKLDTFDKKIVDLRKLTGVWVPESVTHKRMRALSLIVTVLQDQVGLADAKFGGSIDTMGRSAVRFMSSEAVVKKMTANLKRTERAAQRGDTAASARLVQLRADLARETEAKDNAMVDFMESSEDNASLGYVLDVMANEGLIIDVNTLFGGTSRLSDVNGNQIQTPIPEDLTRYESMELPMAATAVAESVPATANGLPIQPALRTTAQPTDQNADKNDDSTKTDGKDGKAKPADKTADDKTKDDKSKDDKPKVDSSKMEVATVSKEDIKLRAQALEEKFRKYFNTEAVQELVRQAKEAGVTITCPTLKELNTLRERLAGPYTTNSATIARRAKTLRELRILRLKMMVFGPQLSEVLTNWIGGADTKLKQALAPVATMAGMNYDTAVQRRHLATILQILSIKDPSARIAELLRQSPETTYAKKGELPITFIRFLLPDNRTDWGNIIARLDNEANGLDQGLKEQFKEYEKAALALGPLKSYDDAIDPLGLLSLSALSTAGAYGSWQGAWWVGTQVYHGGVGVVNSEAWSAMTTFLLHLAGR